MNAGYATPTATARSAHRPTAMTGSTQPRRLMLTIIRIAANSEIAISSLSAGSWALTSVYVAPWTAPRDEKFSVALQPVAQRFEQGQRREQHREMRLHLRRDALQRRLQP